MQIKNLNLLGLSLILCLGTGLLGSLFTIPSIPTWYQSLNKPFFSPPNFVFAPVWTTLYILMAISLYLVLVKKPKNNLPIKFFLIQLLLNFFWSIIFFYIHAPLVAFFDILLLFTFIALTIEAFYKVNKVASYLLVPYILWVSFAAILNLSIVILNKP